MCDRLLIPVDGSDVAQRAAQRGVELARVADAEVDVLHVVEQRAIRITRTDAERARLRASWASRSSRRSMPSRRSADGP